MGIPLGTLRAAERIRADQGNHEAEISCGGEADLHRHNERCKKNPGHSQYKPLQDFKIEHLPPDHRNMAVFRWIKSEADLTCRLLVKYISENRPQDDPSRPGKTYPFYKYRGKAFLMTGTGWVSGVRRYSERDCECNECTKTGKHRTTPRRVWGEVQILTACHVVFDDDEAKRTTCYFGYDTSATEPKTCLQLTGLRADENSIEGDTCVMSYVTHDMKIFKKLEDMCDHHDDLWDEVMQKYEPETNKCLSAPTVKRSRPFAPCPVVVISHPHGCSKQLSIGMVKERKLADRPIEYQHDDGSVANMVNARYTYDAATCPGSSGAPVFKLPERESWWARSGIFHSEGGIDREGNNINNSGIWMEMDSIIPDRASPDCHLT